MARRSRRHRKSSPKRQRTWRFEQLEQRWLLAGVVKSIPLEPPESHNYGPWTDAFPPDAPLTEADTFRLESRPGADHTIFLDFDGHITEGTYWNSSYGVDTIISPPYDMDGHPDTFSASELRRIRDVWKRVAEDFAPFNVNVTTIDPGVDALRDTGQGDSQWGIRVVITDDTFANCRCGGHAYINSFNYSIDVPAFVYNGGLDGISEAATHEVGHTLNLSHDGAGGTEYYQGHGSGNTGWAPIMGAGYYKEVTTWDNGVYYNANNGGSNANYGNGPDDLGVITTLNGFGFRSDDHGDTPASATQLYVSNTTAVSGFGIIERADDVDLFAFETGAGPVSFSVSPLGDRPNLDIWVGLYSESGTLLAQGHPLNQLSASLSNVTLDAGRYYLKVEGVSSHGVYDPASDRVHDPDPPAPWQTNPPAGYSEYGSLGQYAIDGTIVTSSIERFRVLAEEADKPEGNGTDTNFTFTITRDGNTSGSAGVDYQVVAAAPARPGENFLPRIDGQDFVGGELPGGRVEFQPGEQHQSITIAVAGDEVFERDESFFVVLDRPSLGWSLGESAARGTIRSDENELALAPAAAWQTHRIEGDTDSDFIYSVYRSGDTSVTTTVDWQVDPSAYPDPVDGADFVGGVLPAGQITFAADEVWQQIVVPIRGDLVLEADEQFDVVLSDPASTIPTTLDAAFVSARGTILNDDEPSDFDFGDAPNGPYGTLVTDDGARHVVGGPQLGATIDTEPTGQPNVAANGDGYDEDGVVFLSPLVAGSTIDLQISAPSGGVLDYFFDFDGAGGFGNSSSEIHRASLVSGTQVVSVTIPADAVPGATFARFRISSSGGLGPRGAASDGEVEDYAITIVAGPPDLDFGDAPDAPYATRSGNRGPAHLLGGPYLGRAADSELDAAANGTATGDGQDDDGVRFGQLLVAGSTAELTLTASAGGGMLDAFFDFDADGTFGSQAAEIVRTELAGGTQSLAVAIPADAVTGTTYARFRLSSSGGLSAIGVGQDGEVEDYQMVILPSQQLQCEPFEDFDNLTVPQLPPGWITTSTAGAPWTTVGSSSHTPPNHAFVPGVGMVSENRLISPAVTLDPTTRQLRFRHHYDTESNYDGGVLEIAINAAPPVDIVEAGGRFVAGGYNSTLSSDFENPLGGRAAWSGNSGGYVDTIVELPSAAMGQTIQLHWVEGTDVGVSDVGWRVDTIEFCGLGGTARDFGDAPDPTYATVSASDGAAHRIHGNLYLGNTVDSEADGWPSVDASGDDADDAVDDEDGVVFPPALSPGEVAQVEVAASAAGLLSGWIDFNGDGDWLDPREQVFGDMPLEAGLNVLSVDVPSESVSGPTFARLRFSTQAGLPPTGTAPDGEVEDHAVEIGSGQAPTANPGGPYQVGQGNTLVLDGSGSSDPDQDAALLEYLWDLDEDGLFGETGPGAKHGDELGMNPTLDAEGLAGETDHQIALRVVDSTGLEDEASATVQVVGLAVQLGAVEEKFGLASYDNQDLQPTTAAVASDGRSLTLEGNAWKTIDFSYQVTSATVLEFDFQSSVEGEIHAIGFDTNNVLSRFTDSFFQLSGTQQWWGYQDFHDYQTGSGTQHFRIPIGQYFTGSVNQLVLVNDDDALAAGASVFSAVRIYENKLNLEVNGTTQSFVLNSYSNQDMLPVTVAIEQSGNQLRMVGNTWKHVDLVYEVTSGTVVEFDFQSDVEGEIHAIGFDVDHTLNRHTDHFFQLSGSQNWWGHQDYHDYQTGSGTQHYVLPIGQYFTGEIGHLVLANDDDAQAAGESIFSNLRIYDRRLKIDVNGTIESFPLESYADQDLLPLAVAIEQDERQLSLVGNTWKSVSLSYTVTPATILEFDFLSSFEGEIHTIGFDDDNVLSRSDHFFQLSGTQSWWGYQDYHDYQTGSGLQHYVIPIGEFFTGDISQLVFGSDDDLSAEADSVWTKLAIYEGP